MGTGDATLDRLGGIDWTFRNAVEEDFGPLFERVAAVVKQSYQEYAGEGEPESGAGGPATGPPRHDTGPPPEDFQGEAPEATTPTSG